MVTCEPSQCKRIIIRFHDGIRWAGHCFGDLFERAPEGIGSIDFVSRDVPFILISVLSLEHPNQ